MMVQISVSVFKKTGRNGYHFIWTDPVTGRRRTRKSGHSKKRDALRAALEFEEKLNRKASPEMLWEEFVEKYDREHLRHLSAAKAYQVNAVFTLFEEATNIERLAQVPELFGIFRLALLDSDITDATKNGYLKHFRAAINWAVSEQLLSEGVEVKFIPTGETEMKGRPLTSAEYQLMLLTAKAKPHGETIEEFLKGLWLSGLRRSEAMRLSWDRDTLFSVDMRGEYPRFRIRKGGQKNKRAQLAPMTPEFIDFLMALPTREGFVFNPTGRIGRFTSDGVGKCVAAIGEAAEIITDEAEGRHATCHDFRRSFGDRWARKVMPADLKELMRHRSIETTMKYYVGRDVDDITARLHKISDQPISTWGKGDDE